MPTSDRVPNFCNTPMPVTVGQRAAGAVAVSYRSPVGPQFDSVDLRFVASFSLSARLFAKPTGYCPSTNSGQNAVGVTVAVSLSVVTVD